MDSLWEIEPHYAWLALGLLLGAAEIAIPGLFLIWMAGAAVIIGLVTWVAPIGVPVQIMLFALLSILAVFTGRRYLARNPIEPADPKMNDRGARAIGETVVVTAAIDESGGRVKLGDGEWLARGPSAGPGTRMRVTGHDGAVLLVEHLH